MHELNVILITDLRDYENKDYFQVQLKIPSPLFKAILDHVVSDKPSNRPNKIDYRKNPNPYESRYGLDWRMEVNKSSFLRCYACVSNIIEHMVSETKRVFKGTTHKNSYLFYYDALSLMTEKENCKWTKEKGYKEMWILPEIDLFASNPVLKCYRGRPPENSPELCNIDSCLNEYFHKAVDCNVWYKNPLHQLYPNFFSIATTKKRTSAYLQNFDPIDGVSPSS